MDNRSFAYMDTMLTLWAEDKHYEDANERLGEHRFSTEEEFLVECVMLWCDREDATERGEI